MTHRNPTHTDENEKAQAIERTNNTISTENVNDVKMLVEMQHMKKECRKRHIPTFPFHFAFKYAQQNGHTSSVSVFNVVGGNLLASLHKEMAKRK